MKVELNKKYRTRNGKDVRILCTDMDQTRQPVVGVVKGHATVHYWTIDGFSSLGRERHALDLIEVREPLECWVRVENGHVDVLQEPETYKVTHEYRLFREVIE